MKRLSALCFIIGFVFILNQPSTSAKDLSPDTIADSFDEVMEERINKYKIPNATISIVYDGDTIFEKGYGYANLGAEKPVDPESTLFRIGSVSKLFTWTAVMQLVEEEKLSLDEDIHTYIDFTIPELEDSGPITLRHLMTHTPGFEDYPEEIFILEENDFPTLDAYVREYLPERIFPAGETIAYSNYGTALAGYIVEQVSGMPFSSYIDEHIFTPLQMEHSTFEQPLPAHLADDIATPYRNVEGEFVKGEFEFLPGPAGAMSTSASDMAHFMTAYLQGGTFQDEEILEQSTVEEMCEQQFTQDPSLHGMGLGFIEGKFNEKRTLFHGGGTMMYNTAFYLLPDEDIGIFLTYSGGDHFLHNEVWQHFLDDFFPVDEGTTLESQPDTKERAEQYTGEYHQNRKSVTTSEKIISLMTGAITVKADEDGKLHITHVGETNEFVEVEPGIYETTRTERTPDAYGNFKRIVFKEDKNGQMMLMADGPMSYTKAPWYASSTFTMGTLGTIIFFIIATLFSWTAVALLRVLRNKKGTANRWAFFAKLTAILHAVTIMLFLIIVLSNGEVSPVYQMPKDAYSSSGDGDAFHFLLYIPIFLSVVLLFFTGIVWKKRVWRLFGRIHYTMYTAFSLILVWIFYYWNLFN